MKNLICIFIILMSPLATSCKEDDVNEDMGNPDPSNSSELAEVISVSVSGEEGQYTFSVGIKSPDTGCDQYADWWEVITRDGELVYRRILAHSHVAEQPFVRSGGNVSISNDQEVFVRAHMNTSGYGVSVYSGSVSGGFTAVSIDENFAGQLEMEQPLPAGCAF